MARGGETWCILRTRGGSTLKLAESLNASGIQAWTPIGIKTKREGRARDRVDTPAPILPTFVFAHSDHIAELTRICGMIVSPHPAFSIFRFLNRIPLIADRDIAELKREEDRISLIQRKKDRKVVPIGSTIRMESGAWRGLSGVVEESDGKFVMVCFGGSQRIKIATWHLPENLLEAGPSISDAAARAAQIARVA